jgi:hypothetical protein
METDFAIVARMRLAHIPPHAYTTSLALSGQRRLSKIILEKQYDLGEAGFVSLVIRNGKAKRGPVSKVCAITAKELALQKCRVYYSTLPELILSRRHLAELHESNISEHVGKGFLVIGDLGDNIKDWSNAEWATVQAYLLTHLAKGGGLILGDNGASEKGLFCSDMVDALTDFSVVEVE